MTDMLIRVDRVWSDDDVTISRVYINGRFICHGLEDEYREDKVPGETRIPAGNYAVTLRTVGGFHQRYSRQYPAFHKGMLWVRDVPNFKFILIHVGNFDRDTDGCLLLGRADFNARAVWSSRPTYERFYKQVWESARDGCLRIEYRDLDRPQSARSS